jgi:hypothetical protein
MTDPSRDAKVTAWHLELTRKIPLHGPNWRPRLTRAPRAHRLRRRTNRIARPFRPAGPADAAKQARQAEHARRLREAKEMALLKMEQTAMEILRMGAD